MGAQDSIEKVLREIHVLFSKAEPYNGSKKNVVVDKNAMMDLLKELNSSMYEMMEEHELTVQSREKANRQHQKQGDDIIFDARKNAEDIYAASVMYSDHVLAEMTEIISNTKDQMEQIHLDLNQKIEAEKKSIKDNQLELKSQLQDLVDTQKYLHLIEDENLRLAKEKESGVDNYVAPAPYADVKPEIKINEDYFKPVGILGEEDNSQAESDLDQAVLSEDLDSQYFNWKQDTDETDKKKEGKKGFSFLGKLGEKE